jgi:hypothetical protein
MVDEIKATGVNFTTGVVGRIRPSTRGAQPDAEKTTDVTDKVEFSELGTWLSRYSEMPQVRTELVDKVRKEIQAGTYETQAKWDQAINSLIDELQA